MLFQQVIEKIVEKHSKLKKIRAYRCSSQKNHIYEYDIKDYFDICRIRLVKLAEFKICEVYVLVNNKYNAKPYDDTFKSALVHCRQVVVPFVNEMFKTNYPLDAEISFTSTELYNLNGDSEKDVDTSFRIGDSPKLYHVECESSPSGSIVVRMYEYDSRIGLQNSMVDDGKLIVEFPSSAVLYLRSNANTPDKLKVCIRVDEREFSYEMPVMKLSNYSLDVIFAKKLYFLLPFYFFVYENDLQVYNSSKDKLQELLHDFEKWISRMMHLDETEMSKQVKDNLLRYARNVAVGLSKNYGMVREGVDAFMGGVVSRYSPVEQEIHDAVEAAVNSTKESTTLNNMLDLYNDGSISLAVAAKKSKLSEIEFLKKYEEFKSRIV